MNNNLSTHGSRHGKLTSLPIQAVTMLDGFWKRRMDANRKFGIPLLYYHLEEHGVLDNLRRISGRKKVERRGPFFSDSDLAKWMEGAAFVLLSEDDPEIAKLLENAIDDMDAAQCDDGYLNSYFTGDLANHRFRNLPVEHELYCAGHIFEAAIAHHRATGSNKFLNIARRYADYLADSFGPGKIEIADGHPEVELALVKLYRATGERDYLDLAGYFLSLQEFAEKKEIEGHAVRACYLTSGAADYVLETGDSQISNALESLWNDMVDRKMYITGGIGSRYYEESFGDPYELPNERAYTETCAAIANIFWNWRMLSMYGDARFADVMERAMYNGFLSGVSLDCAKYFYMNPLACFKEYQRVSWFDCTCCPTNAVRMIASIPRYLYSSSEEGIWVHLYDNSRLEWRTISGVNFSIEQKTNYPWDGDIEIEVSPKKPVKFSLFLRIPSWCARAKISINGKGMTDISPGEYCKIEREWKHGDVVQLSLPMPVTLQESDPRVMENYGSVAIQRGPLAYCFESADNPEIPIRDVELLVDEPLKDEFEANLLGGVTAIRGKGLYPSPNHDRGPLYHPMGERELDMQSANLKAIPYYAWANRGASQMKVWIPKR